MDASLSYRVTTRRHCLILLKNRSIKFRARYRCGPISPTRSSQDQISDLFGRSAFSKQAAYPPAKSCSGLVASPLPPSARGSASLRSSRPSSLRIEPCRPPLAVTFVEYRLAMAHMPSSLGFANLGTGCPDCRRDTSANSPCTPAAHLLSGPSGGFQDQLGDLVGMRDQREMARLHFDGLGAHALGHEAFEIGIDRPVFRGNGIETRLRPPGRMCGLAREQSLLERLLDRIEDLRLRFRQVAREIVQERGLVETPFIAVEDDPGGGGWRRKCLGQRRVILARIRRPRRHIDKGRHVRMYTGLCHDHAG